MKKIQLSFRFFLLLFVFFLTFAGLLFDHMTAGFSLRQIASCLSYDSAYSSLPVAAEKKEEIAKILSQPFTYIDKGTQFYAFGSEDGKYVLKFFKHKHLHPLTWLRKIPMPEKIKSYAEKKIVRRQKRVHKFFSSVKLAFEEAPQESGLITIHLNRTNEFGKEVLLIDKAGIRHHVAIDDYEFLLQKRAIPVQKVIATLAEKGDESSLQEKIHQITTIVASRCDKGIRDDDSAFVRNTSFAVDGSGAIFIDVGRFFRDSEVKKQEVKKSEVLYRLTVLRQWMEKNFPSYSHLVDKEIALLEEIK